ncbi:hypothetical protein QOT17_016630 [Balamuthia mandrillaris]
MGEGGRKVKLLPLIAILLILVPIATCIVALSSFDKGWAKGDADVREVGWLEGTFVLCTNASAASNDGVCPPGQEEETSMRLSDYELEDSWQKGGYAAAGGSGAALVLSFVFVVLCLVRAFSLGNKKKMSPLAAVIGLLAVIMMGMAVGTWGAYTHETRQDVDAEIDYAPILVVVGACFAAIASILVLLSAQRDLILFRLCAGQDG